MGRERGTHTAGLLDGACALYPCWMSLYFGRPCCEAAAERTLLGKPMLEVGRRARTAAGRRWSWPDALEMLETSIATTAVPCLFVGDWSKAMGFRLSPRWPAAPSQAPV